MDQTIARALEAKKIAEIIEKVVTGNDPGVAVQKEYERT